MKKITDFTKLKVGNWFLSIWKDTPKRNKKISVVKKITKDGFIRNAWTLKGDLRDNTKDVTLNGSWNITNYNFYKLNKEEIKKYMPELTLKELERTK